MKVTPIGKNFNQHKIGDVFEIPDKAALILIKIGKVQEVTQAMKTEDAEISPRTGQPKRAYRRRDMQAES
jgi:hypothetical protein